MVRNQHMQRILAKVGLAFGILIGLQLLENYGGFLLFHSVAEIFSIAVAFTFFMIVWNCREFIQSHFLIHLGITYLFVAIIDIFHTLSYSGMGVFSSSNTNLSTQLWIAARWLESCGFLVALILFRRQLPPWLLITGYGMLCSILLASIFVYPIFPMCFIDGQGLLPFKIWSEYLICTILVIALVLLYDNKKDLGPRIYWLLSSSVTLTILAELAFTTYTSPYGFTNLLGHYLKIASFYLIYLALIHEGLRRPYRVLFHHLEQTKRDLETRVSERTLELTRSRERIRQNEKALATLTEQLLQTEEREKRRVATALHDSVAQVLAFAKREISSLAKHAPPDSRERFETLKQHIALAIIQTRDITFNLSPSTLYTFGLKAALEELAEEIEQREGLTCHLHVAGPPLSLSDDLKILLYRSVRELLINIIKHAHAKQADIFMTTEPDVIIIEVHDNGKGFNTQRLRRTTRGIHHFGLYSIRQRITHLGGSFSIESQPKQGTQARFWLPLAPPLEEERSDMHEHSHLTR